MYTDKDLEEVNWEPLCAVAKENAKKRQSLKEQVQLKIKSVKRKLQFSEMMRM